jgi:peptidyl-prolyl cis-trans isomerase C
MTLQPARLLVALIAAIALPVLAQNLATVNGKKIPSSAADAMVKQAATQGQQDTPELRKMVKEQLVTQELLFQEATKQGYAKNPEVNAQIEQVRQTIIIRAMLGDYFKKNPITDKDIQAEYDKYKAGTGGDKEYNARHILVEKEEEAKAIIAKLKAGGKFEELAKASKDPGSAANGGSLDWAPAGNYVPEFGAALKKLEKGAITETPVKTQFGFHVIKLEDVRAAKPRTFEELKPQISQQMQQKKFQEFQEGLRKKATITQ